MSVLLQPGEFYGLTQFGACNAGLEVRATVAAGSEDHVQLHTHQDAHFVLVLSGTYISSARGTGRLLPSPVLIFNPPGTTHRDRFAGAVGSFMTVSIPAATFQEIPAAGPLAAEALRVRGPDALTAAFCIVRELRRARDAQVLESSVWELFGRAAGDRSQVAEPQNWLHRAYEAIMDQSTDTDLRVRNIATAAGVHPVHLARAFRARWGCSPGELVRWRRVDRAAELLRGSHMMAAEVAAAAGFVDQSHMTHAFRATYGMTPAAYRRCMLHGYKRPQIPPG
jgi:AraC family transcriptional regulator